MKMPILGWIVQFCVGILLYLAWVGLHTRGAFDQSGGIWTFFGFAFAADTSFSFRQVTDCIQSQFTTWLKERYMKRAGIKSDDMDEGDEKLVLDGAGPYITQFKRLMGLPTFVYQWIARIFAAIIVAASYLGTARCRISQDYFVLAPFPVIAYILTAFIAVLFVYMTFDSTFVAPVRVGDSAAKKKRSAKRKKKNAMKELNQFVDKANNADCK